MENCFVEKYKASVINDNLVELGTMVFDVAPNQSTATMDWGVFYPCKVIVTGTAGVYNDAGTQRLDVDGVYTVNNADMYAKIIGGVSGGKAIVKPKYNMRRMELVINPKETVGDIMVWFNGSISKVTLNNMFGKNITKAFEGKTGITEFTGSADVINSNIIGDVKDLIASSGTLTKINISLSHIHCDLTDVVEYSNLTAFEAGINNNVFGDASIFTDSAVLPNLTRLNLVNSINVTNRTASIKAAIESSHPGITVIF